MAAGWSVLDALNKNSKAAVEETVNARFRTREISIMKIYPNDGNFYSITGVEELAQKILAVGLLENLTVAYAPCEKGEYRIIAGEKRWRALKLLVESGHEEFEIVTCQIKQPTSQQEETVQLIVANAYRDKTVTDILQEEQVLKQALTEIQEQDATLGGFKASSGRLRDAIASIMNTSSTKVAQIESINKRLIEEFTEELKEGRLTFSAAYELSGMTAEGQKEMLERFKETGSLTWKDVKEAKAAQAAAEAAVQIEGQMTYPEDYEEDTEEDEEPEEQDTEDEDGERWQDAHPESITFICYGCQRYSDCNVKTSTCTSCDQYIDKAEAEKTEEQRYNEEQDAIDRETAKKLRDMEQEEKMNNLPTDDGKKKMIRMASSTFQKIASGQQSFFILKAEGFREGTQFLMMEFSEGRATGNQMELQVQHMEDASTSSAIEEGYCVLGVKIIPEQRLKDAAQDAMAYADNPTMEFGA